jgi:hypothetical protein
VSNGRGGGITGKETRIGRGREEEEKGNNKEGREGKGRNHSVYSLLSTQ